MYAVNGVISVALGSVYLFRQTFMPYHETALGRSWSELAPEVQFLLEALMDVAGAGWIALGVAVLFLTAIPMRRGERWARLLVPALLLLFYVPNLLATLTVLNETAASPPWYGNAVACLTTIGAFVIDAPWRRKA